MIKRLCKQTVWNDQAARAFRETSGHKTSKAARTFPEASGHKTIARHFPKARGLKTIARPFPDTGGHKMIKLRRPFRTRAGTRRS